MSEVKKLGPTALTAIVLIVQKGLVEQTDISQELRELELEEDAAGLLQAKVKEQA